MYQIKNYRFICFIAMFLVPFQVFATTYYLDSGAGSNMNDGKSASFAWKTIAKLKSVCSEFQPGDQILFKRGGNWNEDLLLNDCGTGNEVSVIAFGSYGTGNLPTLDSISIEGIQPTGSNCNYTVESSAIKAYYYIHDFILDSAGFYARFADNICIENVEIKKSTISAGIYTETNKNLIFRNIRSHDNKDHGAYISGNSENIIIEDSIFYNNGGTGIQFNSAGIHNSLTGQVTGIVNSVLRRNIFFSNKLTQINDYITDNLLFENNIVFDDANAGAILIGENICGSCTCSSKDNIASKNGTYYNNTIIEKTPWIEGLKIHDAVTNTMFYNNIVYMNSGNSISFESPKIGTNSFDYNCYVGNPNTLKFLDWNKSFTQWQNTSGNPDSHSLFFSQTNQIFTKNQPDSYIKGNLLSFENSFDFHLIFSSACIDAGSDVGTMHDFDQNTRPQGNGFDIGAYEFTTVHLSDVIIILKVLSGQ